MVRLRAFSLIELMVVIAIVTVLTVIALPAYQQYVTKAKAAKALIYVDSVITNAKHFYSVNGRFPTLAEVNLPVGAGDGTVTPVPNSVADYLAPNLATMLLLNEPMPNCNLLTVGANLSNFSTGDYFTGNGSLTQVRYHIVDVDGVLIEFCEYASGLNDAVIISKCIGSDEDAAREFHNYLDSVCM